MVLDGRHERCWNLFLKQFLHVQIGKERMHQYFVHVVVLTKALSTVLVQHLGDEVSRVRTDFDIVLSFLGPANWRVLNQIVHLIFVWIVKWRDSNDHLVNEDSESPPVQRLVVT